MVGILRGVFLVVRSDVADPSTAVTGRQQQTTDGRFIVSIIVIIAVIIAFITLTMKMKWEDTVFIHYLLLPPCFNVHAQIASTLGSEYWRGFVNHLNCKHMFHKRPELSYTVTSAFQIDGRYRLRFVNC